MRYLLTILLFGFGLVANAQFNDVYRQHRLLDVDQQATDTILTYGTDKVVYKSAITDLPGISGTDDQILSDGGRVGTQQTIQLENGGTVVIDVADNDNSSTNEIELPATATDGHVLTYDGVNGWEANAPTGGGGSTEEADLKTIIGVGTVGDPFKVDTSLVSTKHYVDSTKESVYLDRFGAIPDDATEDDAGFLAAITDATTNDKTYIYASAGGVYNITDLTLQGLRSDSSRLVIDGRGATIRFAEQTAQQGNIYMRNFEQVTWVNWNFEGVFKSSYTYNENNTFFYDYQGAFTRFENCQVRNVLSHFYIGDLYDAVVTVEREGTSFTNVVFYGSAEDPLSVEQSYVKFKNGAEYNNFTNVRFYDGVSAVRSIGGANDFYTSIFAIRMSSSLPSRLNNWDNGIFYYEFGDNSGKVNMNGVKINHNISGITPIVIKGDPTKTKNEVLLSNLEMLVNGVAGGSGGFDQIYLKDVPDSKISVANIRPFGNTAQPAIILENSDRVSFDQVAIRDGGYAFQLNNSDSVKLGIKNYSGLTSFIDPSSTGGSFFYESDYPSYIGRGTATSDAFLAEGSPYKIDGEDLVRYKNSTTNDALETPRVTIDNGTMLSGTATTAGNDMFSVTDPNKPASWETNYIDWEVRYRTAPGWSGNRTEFFGFLGQHGYQVYSTTGGDLVLQGRDGVPTTFTDQGAAAGYDDGEWHTIRLFKDPLDDFAKLQFDGVQVATFDASTIDYSINTGLFISGDAYTASRGFDGDYDYISINGDRYEFGSNDATTTYTTVGTTSGTDGKIGILEILGADLTSVYEGKLSIVAPSLASQNQVLTSNRTVELGNNNITFAGSNNSFTVESSDVFFTGANGASFDSAVTVGDQLEVENKATTGRAFLQVDDLLNGDSFNLQSPRSTGTIMVWVTPPATSSSTGTAGQMAYDADYLYICYATDLWSREPLTKTWP